MLPFGSAYEGEAAVGLSSNVNPNLEAEVILANAHDSKLSKGKTVRVNGCCLYGPCLVYHASQVPTHPRPEWE